MAYSADMFILLQQPQTKQKLMQARFRELNTKICKSTFQIDGLMSSLLLYDEPVLTPTKECTHCGKAGLSNPEESPIMNKKATTKCMELKNVSPQTNSIKLRQDADRCKNSDQQSGYFNSQLKRASISTHDKLEKQKQEIHQDTKFAIGEKFYPAPQPIDQISSKMLMREKILPKDEQEVKENKIISSFDYHYVLQYAKNRAPLSSESKPQDIYHYFREFASFFGKPLIKKFRNCLYFGQFPATRESQKYYGFLYFFTPKIHYGFFKNQYKHGLGVEINLTDSIIYKGKFDKGHKIGKFQVFSIDYTYSGYLYRGKYHGYGRLETPISIYEGEFKDGMRDGEGEEYFFKSGLKLRGKFERNQFCNVEKQKMTKMSSNEKNLMLSSRINIVPKLNSVQYSFHDDSDSQLEDNRKKMSSKHYNLIRKYSSNEKNRKQLYKEEIQEASDEDPLPPPFRRMAYNK